ncbi:hypothetical protein [Mesorhizobium tamadayense]|uniref:hypothetical protein n=1 Tax=Mesorhizobium tamadayense TaxID=425306 RepID=UPI0026AF4577
MRLSGLVARATMLLASAVPAGAHPHVFAAIAQNQKRLTEAFFTDPSGTDLGTIFATRLELTCA